MEADVGNDPLVDKDRCRYVDDTERDAMKQFTVANGTVHVEGQTVL